MKEPKKLLATDCAKLLRTELKRDFPGVKFSVRTTDRGTLYVSWIDGPTASAVEKLAKQYEASGFDGSIDLQYYKRHYLTWEGFVRYAGTTGTEGSGGSHPAENLAIPDGCEPVDIYTSFVFCERHYKPSTVSAMYEKLRKVWACFIDGPALHVETCSNGAANWYFSHRAEHGDEANATLRKYLNESDFR